MVGVHFVGGWIGSLWLGLFATNSVNAAMLKKGFQHQNMRPEDEMFNNEHVELFYGEAEVDGVTGFVERNNYLDRN